MKYDLGGRRRRPVRRPLSVTSDHLMGIDHFSSSMSEAGQLSHQQVSTDGTRASSSTSRSCHLLVGEVAFDGWWDVVL